MGLGWFDAIAGAALPISTGLQQGRMAGQEEQRRRAEEVLRSQLLQAQIAQAQRPDAWQPTSKEEYLQVHSTPRETPEYKPTTREEAEGFYRATHPNPTTENIDPLSEGGISAALKKRRGERQVDRAFPGPPSDTEAADQAQGDAILGSVNDPKIVGPFGQAYQAIRATNPQMKPGLVAKRAMEALHTNRPDLFRAPKGAGVLDAYLGGGDTPTPGDVPDATAPTAATSPRELAPGATPPPTGPMATDPAAKGDQEAMAQRWDELTAQGMNPDSAKAQVIREFGGR